jgi:hypothetical protein
MLSPHIVAALAAQREADLQRRADRARLHRPESEGPGAGPTGPRTLSSRRWHGRRRRRHLRLV